MMNWAKDYVCLRQRYTIKSKYAYSFLWLETLACTEKLYLEDGQRAKAETKQNETYLKKERAFDSCKDLLSLYPLSQLAMSKNFSVQAANHI